FAASTIGPSSGIFSSPSTSTRATARRAAVVSAGPFLRNQERSAAGESCSAGNPFDASFAALRTDDTVPAPPTGRADEMPADAAPRSGVILLTTPEPEFEGRTADNSSGRAAVRGEGAIGR